MRFLLALAFLLGFVGVLMGALGAHALGPETSVVTSERLVDLKSNWRTGTNFLFFHVLACLICLQLVVRNKLFFWAGAVLLAGGTLFASGIWIGALSEVHVLPYAPLGIIAPVGGLTMMAGWLIGSFAALRASG